MADALVRTVFPFRSHTTQVILSKDTDIPQIVEFVERRATLPNLLLLILNLDILEIPPFAVTSRKSYPGLFK